MLGECGEVRPVRPGRPANPVPLYVCHSTAFEEYASSALSSACCRTCSTYTLPNFSCSQTRSLLLCERVLAPALLSASYAATVQVRIKRYPTAGRVATHMTALFGQRHGGCELGNDVWYGALCMCIARALADTDIRPTRSPGPTRHLAGPSEDGWGIILRPKGDARGVSFFPHRSAFWQLLCLL
jgi:hypothetical protein